VRALKGDKTFVERLEFTPLRVCARHVHAQRSILRAVGIDQERQWVGHQPARSRRNQQAQRVRADKRVLDLKPILAKSRKLVHAGSPLSVAAATISNRDDDCAR
jgi:hypothetical protein